MGVERHFLGWDRPVTTEVREFLVPVAPSDPVDLGNVLVVAPTRHAGRRLRAELARFCSDHNTALLSVQVVTPGVLLDFAGSTGKEASESLATAIWAEVLQQADVSRHPAFFAAVPSERDFAWALQTAEMIEEVRASLADARLCIADVPDACGEHLQEPERWRDLESLETAYLEKLKAAGYADGLHARIARAAVPTLPVGTQRVVVACAPDLSTLVTRALESLSARIPVDVLVHAPASLAGLFDTWGGPIADKWNARRIDIPQPAKSVLLAGTPLSQAERVVEEVRTSVYAPEDIALGVPDRTVIAPLEEALGAAGISSFDPSDRWLREHALYRLLAAFESVVGDGSYEAVSMFLRHPDVLAHVCAEGDVTPAALLADMDAYQNTFLPQSFDDFALRFEGIAFRGCKGIRERFEEAGHAVEYIARLRATFEREPMTEAVRKCLQKIYVQRLLQSNVECDREFAEAAGQVDAVLHEFEDPGLQALGYDNARLLTLLNRRLAVERIHKETARAVVDLEGWVELPWNNAPFLIVTGMNEGVVPGGRLADAFLPDSMRSLMGLRDDAARAARDAFIMQSCIEPRRRAGQVRFIAGKTASSGDPLLPSRLLFRCTDRQLPGRAERLFGSVAPERENIASSISFPLDPATAKEERELPRSMSVTTFRQYLACPLRFYLSQIVGMAAMGDDKDGPDALDFGSMMHDVLEAMGRDRALWGGTDAEKLRRVLEEMAEQWMTERFGLTRTLAVSVALNAAKQRLGAAAAVQVDLVRDGWEIIEAERKIETVIAGMPVRGKIDRVDRHRETGAVRIIDYKTSDSAVTPRDAHLKRASDDTDGYMRVDTDGKSMRWVDLQLPLYDTLRMTWMPDMQDCVPAYFNLPKAVTQTSVSAWGGFSATLRTSAEECAAEIVRRIQGGVFWPPAARVEYDDFEVLFPDDPEKCIAPAAIEFLRGTEDGREKAQKAQKG